MVPRISSFPWPISAWSWISYVSGGTTSPTMNSLASAMLTRRAKIPPSWIGLRGQTRRLRAWPNRLMKRLCSRLLWHHAVLAQSQGSESEVRASLLCGSRLDKLECRAIGGHERLILCNVFGDLGFAIGPVVEAREIPEKRCFISYLCSAIKG